MGWSVNGGGRWTADSTSSGAPPARKIKANKLVCTTPGNFSLTKGVGGPTILSFTALAANATIDLNGMVLHNPHCPSSGGTAVCDIYVY